MSHFQHIGGAWLLSLLAVVSARAMPPRSEASGPTTARRATDFLNSIGAVSCISRRGETLQGTIAAAKFTGIRWFRAGYEGDVPLADFIELHQRTGARFTYGLLSGGSDIARLTEGARTLAQAGALLALEGPNEPNNWGITYRGQAGGRDKSWLPVAALQADLYKAVKGDAVLRKYPVWSITEGGAETDNVGLQYLTIPPGAGTAMPAGTKYADYANVHDYIYHPNAPGLADNKTWDAADPTSACKVDGLFGEYGTTWARHFPGYSASALLTLPRVTTETGTLIEGAVTEDIHALNLLSLYLDQFKRGWAYTSVYLLRDRVDEGGNQQFGFYKPDCAPRKAAVYLHNLTTILADGAADFVPGKLSYSVANEPATVHDMLLQRSDGTFLLVIWDERVRGSDNVTVDLGGNVASVRIYDPTIGAAPIRTHARVSSLALTLSDHPLVVAVPGRTGR